MVEKCAAVREVGDVSEGTWAGGGGSVSGVGVRVSKGVDLLERWWRCCRRETKEEEEEEDGDGGS